MFMGRRLCSGVSRCMFILMFEIKFYDVRKFKLYGIFDCKVKEVGWLIIDLLELF